MTMKLGGTRNKMIAGAAALALAAGAFVATAQPAAARPWHGGHHGFWPGAVAAGIVGGTIAAATSPFWGPDYYDYGPGYTYGPVYAPGYAYAPGPLVASGGDVRSCEAHYRSYNPATGTYLGYDGAYHHCP
jgi:hypothetical protein